MTKTIFSLLLILCSNLPEIYSQEDSTLPNEKLIVGVNLNPPYITKDHNNNWDGISVRLWREMADKMNRTYEFQEIPEAKDSSAFETVDLLLLADISEEMEQQMDFTHTYHVSEIGAATATGNNIKSVLKAFFSKRFWYIVASLSILLLIVGTIIYFTERRSNEDNFGGNRSVLKGIGSGFWWAGVTMTTIGYGDKAPITFLGRTIALLWMLVAMGVTSVLTASIVSAVMDNNSNQINVPNDLRNMRVAVVSGSNAYTYLEEERVAGQEYDDLSNALKAINVNDADVVLHSVPEMQYEINNNSKLSAKVRTIHVDPHYYAIAVPTNSELRKTFNQALVEVIKSPAWQKELDRFIPDAN